MTIKQARLTIIRVGLTIIVSKVTIKFFQASRSSRFYSKMTIKSLEVTIISSQVMIKIRADDKTDSIDDYPKLTEEYLTQADD